MLVALSMAGGIYADGLKVDLNPPGRRGDVLSPHWENWPCKEGAVLSNKFGEITVVFRATNGSVFVPLLNKAALDYAAHMVADGIATRGPGAAAFDIVIGGLPPGKHTIATYHNEVRDVKPTSLSISVDDKVQVESLVPSRRATNDYEAASAFLEVEAGAGKDVVIHVESTRLQASSSILLRQKRYGGLEETPNSGLETPSSSGNAPGKVGRAVPSAPNGGQEGDIRASSGDRRRAGDSAPYLAPAPPSLVINGFEIDTVDPHKKAIKPSPANDDEHVDPPTYLAWTAASGAVAHEVYFGTDSNAVATATKNSSEFFGKFEITQLQLSGSLRRPTERSPNSAGLAQGVVSPSPPLEERVGERRPFSSRTVAGSSTGQWDTQKSYFWRVDEVDTAGAVTRGETWRFRVRSLAFPTAEGYGRFARGGRGGRVLEVTNLKDYDPTKGERVIPGSFRAAVESEGPRTVVFRVSGVIRLKRPCAVTKPYCTIAGQTAPGDGICLANYSAGAFGTHDVIIRFMRFRIGDAAKKAMDGAGLGSCDHCIMDHCSISWSSDEGTSSRGAKNITFQRNIVAEALHHSYHYRASDRSKFETHAFAGSISGGIGSFHHNLLAHCTDRNWSLAGGYNQGGMYTGVLDIRNNVVYNWTARTSDGGVAQMNYVNNYYKPYAENPYVKWLLKLDPINPVHGTEKYFMAGNILEGVNCEDDNWKAFHNGPAVEKLVRMNKPLFEPYVRTQPAREAFTNVLANVGATFPKQDVIDRRIIEEARTGTTHYTGTKGATYGDRPSRNFAGIIDEPTDDKDAEGSPDSPWPEYRTYNVRADTDHDGIPDDWERRAGLDPNNPNDANELRDGYTNLEGYLGWLVGEFPDPSQLKL